MRVHVMPGVCMHACNARTFSVAEPGGRVGLCKRGSINIRWGYEIGHKMGYETGAPWEVLDEGHHGKCLIKGQRVKAIINAAATWGVDSAQATH
eukprot:363288-Chlamydomonas_euryale.AAC.3